MAELSDQSRCFSVELVVVVMAKPGGEVGQAEKPSGERALLIALER